MRRVLATMAVACLALAPSIAAAQRAAEPSAYELEVWRAASRIDTAEAYRAYLKEFPTGAFVQFAQLALLKLRVAPPAAPAGAAVTAASGTATETASAAAAPAAAPGVILDGATFRPEVRPFKGPLNTGTISIEPGDALTGPGVITVGWLGAKRQFVIPRGTWTLLVAQDHTQMALRYRAEMTTLVFGEFGGTQLRSVLIGTFNRFGVPRRSGPTDVLQANGSLPKWTEADDCQAKRPDDLHRSVGVSGSVTWCTRARRTTGAPDIDETLSGFRAELDNALAQAGARMSGFQVRSEVHLTDLQFGYLRYTKLDCVEAAQADAPCASTPASAAAVAGRVAWLDSFLSFATQGYRRDLDVADLEPGKSVNALISFPR